MAKLKKDIYDFETKEAFLKYIGNSDASIATYANILNKIGIEEAEIKKEIYNMDKNEIEKVFYTFGIRGINSMVNAMYFCKRYIEWAKKHGYAKHNVDLLPVKFNKEYASRFVLDVKNRTYTREEILEYIQEMDDLRYATAILCLFEGIKGQGLEEIANLKVSSLRMINDDDFDYHYIAYLSSDREVVISEELYDMLMELDKMKYVGTLELSARFTLVDSPYIFKKVLRKNALNDDKINVTFMTRTIRSAREVFHNSKLVANDIIKSGIAHYANELMEQSGERLLTFEMMKLIALKFSIGLLDKENTDSVSIMDKYYYSYSAIIKNIDEKFINKVYGEFEYESSKKVHL